MEQYRYRLESKGNQHICPGCDRKTFARYIDTGTGEYLDDNVGLCNRRDKCGYHRPPRDFFKDNPEKRANGSISPDSINVEKDAQVSIPPAFIDPTLCKKTLSKYPHNNFVQFLRTIYDDDTVQKLVNKYSIGTASYNRTIFWQIDKDYKIRRGKIMLYNSETGKRAAGGEGTNSAHSIFKIQAPQMPQCFFGEHLLAKFPDKPVAIFESEKTAIIAAAVLTDFICLASGGKNGLNEDKCQALAGREAFLFPDLKAYDLWSQKAAEFKHVVKLTVSNLLEKKATEQERAEGLDIADYLVSSLKSYKNKNNMVNKVTQPTQPTQNIGQQANTVCHEKKETYSTPIEFTPSQQTIPCKDDKQKTPVAKTAEELKQRYDHLRFSALGKIKFLIECPEYKQGTINFYLFYRLITAGTQHEIMELFSDNPYYPRYRPMDKLPNRPEFDYLKNDGIALIKERVYSVYLFHKIWNPDHLKHSGLLYFSLSKDDFENKEAFSDAKEKIKSLPNVVLVYTSTYEHFYGPHSNIVLAVYCGELPNVSGLPRDYMDCRCLDGYNERWMQYMKLIKQVLEIKKNYTNPNLSLVLTTDPEAWFNTDTSQFLNWQKLVTEYEL